jgi:hypothetical protein
MLQDSRELKEARFYKRVMNAKKLQLPSWWRALAPRQGPRFWSTVEKMRKEAGVARGDVDGITYIVNQLGGFRMADINDITDALAKQFGGIDIDEDKKKEAPARPAPREYSNGSSSEGARRSTYVPNESNAPKIWPSERMELRDTGSVVALPKRTPVQIFSFSDEEIEWMFNTPVKRGWEFKDWLEIIGLPRDLHEKHDGVTYTYAARAYLNRKKEAHQGK